jgi:Family of unknown function (DUF5678)
MNKQSPLESLLTSPLLEARTLERQGQVRVAHQRSLTAKGTQAIESLSDQLAGNVAVFPNANRIINNKQGVFVPQSLLGANTDIDWEVNHSNDKTTRVTIKASPKSKSKTVHQTRKAIDYTKELQWIAEHRQNFAGQWVALNGNNLIAAGPNAKEVYKAARESGVRLPLVVLIESPNELPFGGW